MAACGAQAKRSRHTLDITFHAPITDIGSSIPLVTVGTKPASILSVQPYGTDAIRFSFAGPFGSAVSTAVPIQESRTYRFTIVTDSNVHDVSVTAGQDKLSVASWLAQARSSSTRQNSASGILRRQ